MKGSLPKQSMGNPTNKSGAKSSKATPVIFCDFDGTITQQDVTDQVLAQFAHPSWREIEQEWARGSIGSRECLLRQMALVDASETELDALIDAIPLDPGFPRFLRWLEKSAWPFYVVSDGFDYIIRRILKRAGVNGQLRNGINLFANTLAIDGRRAKISFPNLSAGCEHGCATCKSEIIERLRPNHGPVIFVGDGLSDRFAVEQADLTLAKHQLHAYCREKDIPCVAIETFDDVIPVLEKFTESGPARGVRKTGTKARRRVEVPAMD